MGGQLDFMTTGLVPPSFPSVQYFFTVTERSEEEYGTEGNEGNEEGCRLCGCPSGVNGCPKTATPAHAVHIPRFHPTASDCQSGFFQPRVRPTIVLALPESSEVSASQTSVPVTLPPLPTGDVTFGDRAIVGGGLG